MAAPMDSNRQAAEVEVRKLAAADGAVRARAAKVLGRMGEAAASHAASALVRCLGDAEEAVRLQSARALGKLGQAAGEQAAEALARSLYDADAGVRAAAAWALGWTGNAAGQGCLDALVEHLADGDAKVRSMAAGALGHLGEWAVCSAAESLALCFNDDDSGVQAAVAGALVRHLDSVAAALVHRLDAGDAKVQKRALQALGHMGVVALPYAEEAVVRRCADLDAEVKAEALTTLGLMRVSAAEPAYGIEPWTQPLPRAREGSVAASSTATTGVASRKADKVVRHAEDVQVLPVASTDDAGPEASTEPRKQKCPPELPWTAGIGQRRLQGEDGGLPRLLGTPTPRAWEKPDFQMPSEDISESDSDEVMRDAVTA